MNELFIKSEKKYIIIYEDKNVLKKLEKGIQKTKKKK